MIPTVSTERGQMTPRERMLTAYLNQQPDTVPVSPEIWDATTVEVSGRPWHELLGPFAKETWWKVHLQTFEFFGADAWIVADPIFPVPVNCSTESESEWIGPDEIETRLIQRTPKGALRTIARSTPTYAGWKIEKPVKRFPQDMEAYEPFLLPSVENVDLSEINGTLAGVGEKGLVTTNMGDLFTSSLAYCMEGGYEAVINALLDYPDYCRDLQTRFIRYQRDLAEVICSKTGIQALFVNSGYSAPPITSPRIYREWDMPALAAACGVAKRYGVAVHVHQHGYVGAIIDCLIDAGVTMVCPLLAPPQGDVADLAEFRRCYGQRIGMKGNIDPFGVLLKGTPEQVDAEVKACIEAGALGGGFILGTQDSTLAGTPFENLRALVEAGRKYGRYEKEGTV